MELQRGKHRAFREDEPVSLRADRALKPSWQTILERKGPRDLPGNALQSLKFFNMPNDPIDVPSNGDVTSC